MLVAQKAPNHFLYHVLNPTQSFTILHLLNCTYCPYYYFRLSLVIVTLLANIILLLSLSYEYKLHIVYGLNLVIGS